MTMHVTFGEQGIGVEAVPDVACTRCRKSVAVARLLLCQGSKRRWRFNCHGATEEVEFIVDRPMGLFGYLTTFKAFA